MNKTQARTFQDRLQEDLQDPEFRSHFEAEQRALDLALKVTRLRKKRGLSQEGLAHLMGTSQQAISRLESGKYRGFSLRTLEKLAEATRTRLKIEFVPGK